MINIDNITIGDSQPCYLIAEISANHCNDFEIAKKTIKAAKESGANAVKIQTYTPDTMTIDCKSDDFRIKGGTIWDGMYEYDLYKEAYMPWDWQPKLQEYASELGITLFSTSFDKTSTDFLEKMNVPAYKIASFEANDLPLVEYIASKGKPVIISTGICYEEEISEIVETCHKAGNEEIILLKCTSSYPAKLEDMNIKVMKDIREKLNVLVGLSDHSMQLECVLAAVSLGACVIEKHFILDRSLGGPDASFSLNPQEFSEMSKSVRNLEKALGTINYKLTESVEKNRCFARSLYVVKDMRAGDTFSLDNIKSIRPGFGLPPKYLYSILGKKIIKDVIRGVPLSWELVDDRISNENE